jgi:DNA repair ATPase RecN
MIEHVHIRHFQSLHDVALDLGPLTVIVGPSSSGKSAFMRALRTLTSNRRGDEFISHGERTASISARTDKGTVTLTRSKKTTDNAYIVTPLDPAHPLAPQREFKKLDARTPPEVSQFLGIASQDPINYAGQFDPPYLLSRKDTSAGEVARTLGSLTNVSVIFEAAAESNRRKLREAATLRTRSDDLQNIKNRVPGYRSLKSQDAALTAAEQHIAAARTIEKRIARLTHALDTIEAAERAVITLTPAASRTVPTEDGIVRAAQKLTAFRDALRTQQSAQQELKQKNAWADETARHLAAQEAVYAKLIGTVSDDLAGWIAATARPGSITSEKAGGQEFIELDEAIRVFTLYIETKATS